VTSRPPRRLLEAEAARREEFREAIKRGVLLSFVVDRSDAEGPGRFAVRRLAVYRAAAEYLRIRLVTAPFCTQVRHVVVALGAIAVRSGGRHLFRGVHRRDICPAQAAVEATGLRAAATGRGGEGGDRGGDGDGENRDYRALLAAEGMPEELAEARLIDAERAAINGLRIDRATDAFWEVDRVHTILRLYMDGCSIREIVERTGLTRKVVHNRLRAHGLSSAEE
jgi:hypothetical protein